jgi:hypothetical protein
MNAIASFMQNETAVIAVGLVGMLLGFVGVVVLGAFSFASLLYRIPGGVLSSVGVAVILAMYAFVQVMTSSMELQYGPAGSVVEYSVYALGGFLCILGYARLALQVLRGRGRQPPNVSIA